MSYLVPRCSSNQEPADASIYIAEYKGPDLKSIYTTELWARSRGSKDYGWNLSNYSLLFSSFHNFSVIYFTSELTGFNPMLTYFTKILTNFLQINI